MVGGRNPFFSKPAGLDANLKLPPTYLQTMHSIGIEDFRLKSNITVPGQLQVQRVGFTPAC